MGKGDKIQLIKVACIGVAVIALILLLLYYVSVLMNDPITLEDVVDRIKMYGKAILYFIISPFVSLYSLCVYVPFLGVAEILYCILLLSLFLIVRRRFYYPVIRSLYNLLLSIFPLFAIYCRVCLFPALPGDVKEMELMCTYFSIVLYIILLYVQLKKKDIFYFVVPKNNIVLYLRKFATEKYSSIDNEIGISIKEDTLLRIGNPSTADGGYAEFSGHTFFLPTKKWKFVVDYYISRARLVLCKIDASEGVAWEMFEHPNAVWKTIYCVDQGIDLSQVLSLYSNKGYEENVLYLCLKKIYDSIGHRPVYMYLEDGRCIYSYTLENILKYLREDSSAKIKTFVTGANRPEKQIDHQKKETIYLFMDGFRYLSMILRPRTIGKVLTRALYYILYVGVICGGIMCLYFGILIILSTFIPSVEGSVFDINNFLEDLDNGIFGKVVLGVCFIGLSWGAVLAKKDYIDKLKV